VADEIENLQRANPLVMLQFCDNSFNVPRKHAEAICREGRHAGLLDRDVTIRPIPTAEYPTPARRPAYSVLDTGKIRAELGLVIPAWRDSLVNMLGELHTCETS
jgi:hypothetical protein